MFEEAFILRMPVPQNEEQTAELNRLTEMVQKREPMDEKDVWFKFMDSRRAVFNLGKTLYSAKLVDLPCIIESQKTIDNKHMFKTADISQVGAVDGSAVQTRMRRLTWATPLQHLSPCNTDAPR